MVLLFVAIVSVAVVGLFWASAVWRVWSRRATSYWGTAMLAWAPLVLGELTIVGMWWFIR